MLRPISSQKRGVSDCSRPSLQASFNFNSTATRLLTNGGHSVGKQQYFHCLSPKPSRSAFSIPKATVHTPSRVPISPHKFFHTSQRLLEETSSVPAQQAPTQELSSTVNNFVEIDQQAPVVTSTPRLTEGAIDNEQIERQLNSISGHVSATPAVTVVSDAEAHFRTGYEHAQKKNHKAAKLAFQKVVKLAPSHYTALYYLGLTYTAMGKQHHAITSFLLSLEQQLNTNDQKLLSDTYYNLGQSYIAVSKFQQALDVMDKILAQDATNKSAHYNRGYCLMMLEILDEAVTCFDAVLQLDPTHIGSLHSKAYTLVIQKKYEEAIKLVKQAEAIYPHDRTLQQYKDHAYKRFFRQRGLYSLTELLGVHPNQQPKPRKGLVEDKDNE